MVQTLVALCAMPLLARAQDARRARRVGVLLLASARSSEVWLAAFRKGMADLRWVEGRDYVIDARFGDGMAKAGPALAAELVAKRPDVVLTGAEEAAKQLIQRSPTLPVVFAVCKDPVGSGIAASLQRPGGSATGLTDLSSGLAGKQLQLLTEAFARVASVAVLFDPSDAGSLSQVREIEDASVHLKIRMLRVELEQDVERAFKRAGAMGAQANLVTSGPLARSHLQSLANASVRARLPAMLPGAQYVEAGGLMSYTTSYADNFRRAAAYVDKILKGAKPGDLPVEQPTKFELVVNLGSARAMGLAFPQSFLVRADRVIE